MPAAFDAVVVAFVVRLAAAREDTADDGFGTREDFARASGRNPTRRGAGRGTDHRDPSCRTVGFGESFDESREGERIGFEAAVIAWHQEAEVAGVAEFLRKIGGETAGGFDFAGAAFQFVVKAAGGRDEIGHSHSASFNLFAMLFFCMLDDPPTMGNEIASRT